MLHVLIYKQNLEATIKAKLCIHVHAL